MVIAFNKATPDLRDVSETVPTEGQALLWKAADSEYQPGDVSVGMSGDGIPDNFSRTEIASFTSSSSGGGVVAVTLSEEIESGHLVSSCWKILEVLLMVMHLFNLMQFLLLRLKRLLRLQQQMQ